jgi:two-component system sensor histidine kinase VicK
MWRNERVGLIMIMASLLVMGVVAYLTIDYQLETRLKQAREQGVGLVRVLGGMSWEELVPTRGKPGILQAVRHGQNNPDFAYGVVVDTQGNAVAEISQPGVIIPARKMPAEPTSWLGERLVKSADTEQNYIEFHAPVFSAGTLMGYVRLGYLKASLGMAFNELSFFATLLLPVFLLMPLFYFLFRREVQPLRVMHENLEKMIGKQGIQRVELQPSGELGEFMQHFMQYVNDTQHHIQSLEIEQSNLLTSSKLLSYKHSRVESILQSLPEAILVLDEAGTVSYVNDRIVNLIGIEKQNIFGKKPHQWSNNPNMIAYLSRHNGANGRVGYISDSIQIVPDNDGEKLLEVKSYPLFSPKDNARLLGSMVVIRDITEEQLIRRNRGEFIAQVAHELKTPLNVLSMYSETLLGDDGNSEAYRTEALNVIHDEVGRLSTLINNMLALSKFELGGMTLKRDRVRLRDLLEDAFNNIVQSDRGKGLEFELDLPKEMSALYVDKDLIRIAVNNLLTNAIKYNRPEGKVTLMAQELDEAVEITVQDTGIGIKPQDQQKIFDKFFRSNDEKVREQTGHGLGLALAQQIINMHHGTLTLESEYAKGTTFVVRLEKENGLSIQQGVA